MSTANYRTMSGFDLYTYEPFYEGFKCPVCGAIHDKDYEVCPACGEAVEMEDGEYYDPFLMDDVCSWVEEEIEQQNERLDFHEIRLLPGYYSGVQFFVDEKDDPSGYDEDDCRWYFGCGLEELQRRYQAEVDSVKQCLEALGREYGFTKKKVMVRFSNGEVMYG